MKKIFIKTLLLLFLILNFPSTVDSLSQRECQAALDNVKYGVHKEKNRLGRETEVDYGSKSDAQNKLKKSAWWGKHCSSVSTSSSGHSAGSISLPNVIWLDTDISGWSQTATLNAGISGNSISLNYDKANSWPVSYPLGGSLELVGNAWFFAPINGQWYASTWEWLRPGQTVKEKQAVYGPGHMKGVLEGYTPIDGETYYFMVSTPARSGVRTTNERSNLAPVTWSGGAYSADGSSGESTEDYLARLSQKSQERIDSFVEKINNTMDTITSKTTATSTKIDPFDNMSDSLQSVIPVEYTYDGETYELKGYLVLPTCYTYDLDIDRTSGNNFRLDITVERESEEVCNRVDSYTFEEEIDYDGDIDLEAYINGNQVDLQLFDFTISEDNSNPSYYDRYYGSDTNYDNDGNMFSYVEDNNTDNDDNNDNSLSTSEISALLNVLVSLGVISAENITQLEAAFNINITATAPNTTTRTTTPTNTTQTTVTTNSGAINTRTSTLLGTNRNNNIFTGYNRDLTIGSQGADVQELQRFLNSNGYVIATTGAGSPGNESTYFGPATQSALIRFQQDNNISPASGYFGPLTRGAVE